MTRPRRDLPFGKNQARGRSDCVVIYQTPIGSDESDGEHQTAGAESDRKAEGITHQALHVVFLLFVHERTHFAAAI